MNEQRNTKGRASWLWLLLPVPMLASASWLAYQIGYTIGMAGGIEAAARQVLGGDESDFPQAGGASSAPGQRAGLFS